LKKIFKSYTVRGMRSYGQYCAIAKALDVIGDRWTMLLVRELLLRGPSRYTDLRDGLPGIATNLLAERLRSLEAAGLVRREDAPPPIAATLFELTPRGEDIAPVLDALGRWGTQYMAEGPAAGDEFRDRWLAWPAQAFLADRRPHEPPVRIALDTGQAPFVIEAAGGEIRTSSDAGEEADAVLSGTPHALLGLLSGSIDLAEARARGVSLSGEERVLARVLPGRAARPSSA
jgi:DNA-binding HxlR family transcriptional regulator